MTSEKWRQIQELYEAANGREPSERATMLQGVDPEIRSQVEAMLAEDSRTAILDQPAACLLENFGPTAVVVGAQILTYRIETKLGEGGMGVVFRAHDTKLDRPVAVKVLSQRIADE